MPWLPSRRPKKKDLCTGCGLFQHGSAIRAHDLSFNGMVQDDQSGLHSLGHSHCLVDGGGFPFNLQPGFGRENDPNGHSHVGIVFYHYQDPHYLVITPRGLLSSLVQGSKLSAVL